MEKKISPSQIVKLIFNDAYKDIPEWILDKAAEFGKDLHEAIQTYINDPDFDDEIKEALCADNKVRLYEAFKKWYSKQDIKEPKTEEHIEDKTLHGYIDLLDNKYKFKFWDYKFRNVDNKLNIAKDILQMKCYQMILKNVYGRAFGWELVIFDKKTAKVYSFLSSDLTIKQEKDFETLINTAIRILSEKTTMEEYNRNILKLVN